MKSSLFKISFALAIISLYTFLFGIMDIVDGEQAGFETPAVSLSDSAGGEGSGATGSGRAPLSPKSTESASTINVANGRTPGFADYEAPVITFGTTATTGIPATESSSDGTTGTSSPASTTVTEVSTLNGTTRTPPPATTTTSAATTTPSRTTATSPVTTGTSPTNDTFRVISNGKVVEGNAFDIVARTVQNEIGGSNQKEAIKAQAVAAYTYIKRENANGKAPTVLLAATANERVSECVRDVWGQAIYYNGELIHAVYSASSAGYSSSAANVWGQDLPYLRSVKCPHDSQHDPNWGRVATFTSEVIKENVLRQTGIQLSGNPENWLRINNHVDEVYVGEMSVGGYNTFTNNGKEVAITGRVFRERIMGFDLRSASFKFVYNPDNDTFDFTTNGYGHGVGLSQHGANILATHHGYNYLEILKYYYTGVDVK